jgi:hypothetical protein
MRAIGFWLCLLALNVVPVLAQVTVEVTQEQQQFLPGEEMLTAVRITNRSGRLLHLGKEADWLTFTVQGREEEVVRKSGEVPVEGEFTLESSKVATKRVDLEPYFELNHSGRYAVIATVRIKDWPDVITSQPRSFDIVEGVKVWEQAVGLPLPEGSTNGRPEVRKYMVQQANYLRQQVQLYVRITDESGARTYKVIKIGAMVSFNRPEPQVDGFSNMHLLYQEGARNFIYLVFNPQGEIMARRTYDIGENRPRLQPDNQGKIMVLGGYRIPSKNDIPPSKEAEPAKAKSNAPAALGEMIPPS